MKVKPMAVIPTLSDEERRKLDETYEQRYEAYVLEVRKDVESFLESVRGKALPAQAGTIKGASTAR